ncbi:NAD(P)H-binding protein [Myxococcus sp. K15C18031901]|uniref:NAD(P)H-binding protein n=1 Tax=Myxococcus dinghuensis TaxID=2906761 RepID=UPI0020A7287A|nr:NAD(P)H-binding protein [Myxococcus dinghuensis]MCP3103903.1 NAD(P)H-binding protein [Myxococcus dinghuensis]
MKVVLFGATGMVGQGVLRECLLAPDVEEVLAVGRSATGQRHDKLRELVRSDLHDYAEVEAQLSGFDACFFCLGVSAAGMREPDYRRITYDLTLAAARTLVRLNPGMTFIYVSGAGTDSTERGRAMWARVKGATENALLQLPFGASYMFRPAFIQPMHGVVSRTGWYRAIYAVFSPLYPLLKRVAPAYVTNTEAVGRAMLEVARHGAPNRVVENAELTVLGTSAGARSHPAAS